MSDNQRRACCRILFLLTCFLPTGVVGYRICHPQTAAGWEQAIKAEFGITTKIDLVETPGPNVTVLNGLEFTDPELGSIFKTFEVRIEVGEKFNLVTIPFPAQNIHSQGLNYFVEAINRNVIRKHGATKHWKIIFEKPTKVQESLIADYQGAHADASVAPLQVVSSVTVSGLQIDLGPAVPHADGTFAVATFKVDGSSASSEAERQVNCAISKTDQHGIVVELETNETPLPCWLLADTISYIPQLGAEATFNGRFTLERGANDQERLDLAGVFRNVELGRSALFVNDPQSAKIEVNKCVYAKGELDWDAFLFHDQERIRIRKESLFNYSKQVDIVSAFSTTLVPNARSAELEKQLR